NFGVSRTVIREAMRILSARGLVETRPRHRPVVRQPNADAAFGALEAIVPQLLTQPGGIRNLFDTRILIEAGLVRSAALNASKEGIAALQSALDENEATIPNSDEFYRTDVAFHRVLYELSGNPMLPALHKAYTVWLAPQWSQMPRLSERNKMNYSAHVQIFDGILRRDPDAAEQALRTHLETAWEHVSRTFDGL
ncbi:MAG: FCD domain-containing protein, partial [Litoreibacter sp.]|nr:FCD domain-containing protein [Litoreibacter sp.]